MTEQGRESTVERWRGADAECASLAWELATGADSIDTVERVYRRTLAGAFECVYPGCRFVRRDAEAMWRHVHTAHGDDSLPPDDFDPGPYLSPCFCRESPLGAAGLILTFGAANEALKGWLGSR